MNINYTQITEENKIDFSSVLPEQMKESHNRISIGAYDDEGYVLGAVSFELVGFQYNIDWIYVHEKVRRQGVGAGLIEQALKAVMGIGERFPVIARFEFSEEDNRMHSFFLSCRNMITTYSHERYYVTAEDVRGSSALHRPSKSETGTRLFFDLPINEQKKILMQLSHEDIYDVADYESWKESCVPQLCRCVYVKNNLLDLVFMQKLSDGNLELSYLYGKYPRGLFELLSDTVREMEVLFPNSTLTFEAMNQDSEQLARHLFPKAKSAHIYEAEF